MGNSTNRRIVIRTLLLALTLAFVALPTAAVSAGTAAPPPSPFIMGTAAVAKGSPIAGGRVSAETVDGAPLAIRWGRYGALRTTRETGAFAIPRAGLPGRFVVVVTGGRALGARSRATFRAIFSNGRNALATAQVSLGTTMQVGVYRRLAGPRAKALRIARQRVIRTLRFPGYVSLGFDDRVNTRYVSSAQVRKLAQSQRGLRRLVRHLTDLAVTRGVVAKPGLGARVRPRARMMEASEPDNPGLCLLTELEWEPEAIASCTFSSTLAVSADAWGINPPSEADSQLAEISAQLVELQAQVSEIEAQLNSDFTALVAQGAQNNYNAQVADINSTTASISSGITALQTIAEFSPGGSKYGNPTPAQIAADKIAVQAQQSYLFGTSTNPGPMSNTRGGFANPATATTLQQAIVGSGSTGSGILPAAWQAVRAEQATGSLGDTENGDAVLGQGTTLYTNEMSSAFSAVSDAWYAYTVSLAVLAANYWNSTFSQTPPPGGLSPQAATAVVLSNGTCASLAQSPCSQSIAGYLQQQVFAMPMTVPAGTVIDPTTNLIWGTAINANVPGSTWPLKTASPQGYPVNASTGAPIVPGLLDQLNAGGTTPWSFTACGGAEAQFSPWPFGTACPVTTSSLAINANLAQVVTKVASAPPNFQINWSLPTANFALGQSLSGNPPSAITPCTRSSACGMLYDASQSPQFGVPAGGSGLFGGLVSGNTQLQNLVGITSPAAFPGGQGPSAWWTGPSTDWYAGCEGGTGPNPSVACQGPGSFSYYPSGVMTFASNSTVRNPAGAPPTTGWMVGVEQGIWPSNQVAGAVLVQSPVPAQQFQYPAVYPQSVLDQAQQPGQSPQVVNLIAAYR